MQVDKKWNSNPHVGSLCKIGSQKMSSLVRVMLYMSVAKKCMLINAFSKSQFRLCPLVWIFQSQNFNNNKLAS